MKNFKVGRPVHIINPNYNYGYKELIIRGELKAKVKHFNYGSVSYCLADIDIAGERSEWELPTNYLHSTRQSALKECEKQLVKENEALDHSISILYQRINKNREQITKLK